MKIAVRAISALVMLAFAAPALPCGDAKQSLASSAAQAEPKDEAVAKSDTKKSEAKPKAEAEKDQGVASNESAGVRQAQ
jgi:hypothetical protein